MLVVALVTATAAALAANLRLEIRRADNLFAAAHGRQVAAGVERAAIAALAHDAETSGHDAADEAWAIDTYQARAPDGTVGDGRLRDLGGLFNLNNLAVTRPGGSNRHGGATAANAATATGATPMSAAQAATTAPGTVVTTAPRNATSAAGTAGASTGAAPGATAAVPSRVDEAATPRVDLSGLADALARVVRVNCTLADGDRRVECQTEERGRREVDPSIVQAFTSAAARADPIAAEGGGGMTPAAARSAPLATTLAPGIDARAGDDGSLPLPPLTAGNAAGPVGAALPPADTAAFGAPTAVAGAVDATAVAARLQAAEVGLRLLLDAADIDADIVQAILDWVDPDSETRFPNGAEDDYYLGRDPPYRAANRPFADVRELRLVRGVTPEIYAHLAPLVTALPQTTPVNANTAPVEVLMSLGPLIDRGIAEQVVNARSARPFQSEGEFEAFFANAGRSLLDGVSVAVNSRYVELSIHVVGPRLDRTVESVLERSGASASRVAHRLGDFE